MNDRLRALCFSLTLVLAACGGGGGGGGGGTTISTAPTANFAFVCTDLSCTFTSTSTNQVVNDTIVAYSWSFGDSTAAVTTQNPQHVFAAAGTYNVTLQVTDLIGATSSVMRAVTVTAAPTPAAPHTNFTVSCVSLDCTFTDTTTFDPGSNRASTLWDFGDGTTSAAASPTHAYSATTVATFTARLTVTDQNGKASTATQTVRVAPQATSLTCESGNCVMALTQPSRVSVTLVSHSCAAQGSRVVVTAPVNETVFTDGCIAPVGTPVFINGGSTFATGTTVEVAILSGILPTSTIAFKPTIRLSGDAANGWTLVFDDGYGGPGEPDFNDLVILVRAVP